MASQDFDYAIHSDFLIYWTGKKFDEKDEDDQPTWCKPGEDKSKISEKETCLYIKRLHDILKHGLWINKSRDPETIKVNGQEFKKPFVARTCFTELKLSEVRKHAKKFGRLGIGFKRYYLFNRLGGPMKYLQFGTLNLSFPPYSVYDKNNPDHEKFSFYKHMCSGKPLTYDLFSESEWRIIYSENIKNKLKREAPERLSLFVDPKESDDKELKQFYDKIQGEKPEYFLPLDAWLAMIIYPSPKVKIEARESIYPLIEKVKSKKTMGCPGYEHKMWPVEVDLDACRNF